VRAAQIGYLLADVDHRAVDIAGHGGPDLAGDDRHHSLIEQGQTFAHPTLLHQGAALEVQRERQQVRVADASTNLSCPSRGSLGPRIVTRCGSLDGGRKQ